MCSDRSRAGWRGCLANDPPGWRGASRPGAPTTDDLRDRVSANHPGRAGHGSFVGLAVPEVRRAGDGREVDGPRAGGAGPRRAGSRGGRRVPRVRTAATSATGGVGRSRRPAPGSDPAHRAASAASSGSSTSIRADPRLELRAGAAPSRPRLDSVGGPVHRQGRHDAQRCGAVRGCCTANAAAYAPPTDMPSAATVVDPQQVECGGRVVGDGGVGRGGAGREAVAGAVDAQQSDAGRREPRPPPNRGCPPRVGAAVEEQHDRAGRPRRRARSAPACRQAG